MTKKNANTNTETADVFASFAKEFAAFPTRFGMPDAGRDAALKGLATARENLAGAQAGAEKFVSEATAAWSGFAREAMDAGFANTNLAFDAFEKMLSAGTPAEAMQVHSTFVQTAATANADRMRKTAEAAQQRVAANAEQFRAEIEKFDPSGRAAA